MPRRKKKEKRCKSDKMRWPTIVSTTSGTTEGNVNDAIHFVNSFSHHIPLLVSFFSLYRAFSPCNTSTLPILLSSHESGRQSVGIELLFSLNAVNLVLISWTNEAAEHNKLHANSVAMQSIHHFCQNTPATSNSVSKSTPWVIRRTSKLRMFVDSWHTVVTVATLTARR